MRVRWLRGALESLHAEAEFIAAENPRAAERVVASINARVARLSRYPALGRIGRVLGTRELVIHGTAYVVPYRVRGEQIEILRVYHAARRWPNEFS